MPAREAVLREGFAREGDVAAVVPGTPFGVPGTTNLLNILRV